MQPSPLPLLRLPRTLLLAALAAATLLAATAPATAMATMTQDRFHAAEISGVGVWVNPDPQADGDLAVMCIEHDSLARWPIDHGYDDDGNYAVWVPAGASEDDGSNKASTSCVTAPPDDIGDAGVGSP